MTDLEKILKNSKRFKWETIKKIHEIGQYAIVEYVVNGTKRSCFGVYVDGVDAHLSTNSLDGAILLAICKKNCGDDVNMARAAAKLLDVK